MITYIKDSGVEMAYWAKDIFVQDPQAGVQDTQDGVQDTQDGAQDTQDGARMWMRPGSRIR